MTALSGLDIEALSLWRGERMLFRDLAFSRAAQAKRCSLKVRTDRARRRSLRAIAGFLEPRAGTIRVRTNDGGEFASGEERAEFIGWLGHQDGAKSQLTPLEALGFYTRYYGSTARVEEALQRVGLSRLGDLPAQYLSAGQKRRLALARLSLVGAAAVAARRTAGVARHVRQGAGRPNSSRNIAGRRPRHHRHPRTARLRRPASDIAERAQHRERLCRTPPSRHAARHARGRKRHAGGRVLCSGCGTRAFGRRRGSEIAGTDRRRRVVGCRRAGGAAVARPHLPERFRRRKPRSDRPRAVAAGSGRTRQDVRALADDGPAADHSFAGAGAALQSAGRRL